MHAEMGSSEEAVVISVREHRAMKVYGGREGKVTRNFNLGTRWRWVVSFTLRQIYPRGYSFSYQFSQEAGRVSERRRLSVFFCSVNWSSI
jgi:hypothetical protein